MNDTARDSRNNDALRSTRLERNAAPYAEGSCLVSTGDTRVLCTATVQPGVPDWRRGSGSGWLTAEYAMLPRSTLRRTGRERSGARGRTQEIQRLIGRALRAAVDLGALGERTILVDCDVLVADGGTRTAAITGAALAVHDACAWIAREHGAASAFRQLVAATSIGIIGGEPRLDLDYREDVAADVDMNIVLLESGGLVEVQGTAEREPFSPAQLDELIRLGLAGCRTLLRLQREAIGG